MVSNLGSPLVYPLSIIRLLFIHSLSCDRLVYQNHQYHYSLHPTNVPSLYCKIFCRTLVTKNALPYTNFPLLCLLSPSVVSPSLCIFYFEIHPIIFIWNFHTYNQIHWAINLDYIRHILQIFQNDIWNINQLGLGIYNKYFRMTCK